MGIKSLQDYLETQCAAACVSVDLLKISRGFVSKRRGRYGGSARFCLVVDAESCLDRLYGGYYSDWVCGGQWNRMTAFLTNLVQACHNANMELVVFFNGGLESERMNDWFADQINQKKKVHSILRHLHNKGTPPPKIWWMPPVFLKGSLKAALRHLNVTVASSMDDHFQEVIGFCREHSLQGIIAQESVYAIFDPPRYFSSNNLKLTYKGSLETKEYIMDEIAKCMDLNPNRFCVFAALLGNHILPEEDLYDFFREQLNACLGKDGKPLKVSPDNVILAVVTFVRQLPATDDLDVIGELVFRNCKGVKQELTVKFKQSVQYYLNGTHEGFLKYRPKPKMGNEGQVGGYPRPDVQQKVPQDIGGYINTLNPNAPDILTNSNSLNKGGIVNGGFDGGLEAQLSGLSLSDRGPGHHPAVAAAVASKMKKAAGSKLPTVTPEIMRIACERHQKGLMSPWIYQLLSQGELKLPVVLEDDTNRELPSYIDLFRPIRQTVYSVLFNLNKNKIIHETNDKEKGDSGTKCFDIPVKEWVIRRGTTRPSFELVIAKPVEWKTPSIERMWLGQNADDKNRRLRAFLTCMQSDSPLMLNTNYVPQPLLVMCCVLRFIIQFGRVLQRQELDAFLAMAVSPLLVDVQTMQDLKLPAIHPRGIQLASLFMSGVETAIFANDVCGAPIPWNMSCPWLFFDGKLFHFKLLKANNNTPLIDMCDGQVDQVLRVERMRQAILENCRAEFAKPLLPTPMYNPYAPGPYQGYPSFPQGGPIGYRPAGAPRMPYGRGGYPAHGHMGGSPGYSAASPPQRSPGRGRGLLGRSPVDARGGQLEIAGVVVGSWGANVPGRRGRSGPTPQIMSVGGARRGYLPNRPIRGRPSLFAARGYRPHQYYEDYYGPRAYDYYEGHHQAPRNYGRIPRPPRKAAVKYRPRASKGKAAKHVPKGRGVTVDTSNDENGVEVEEDGAAAEEATLNEEPIGVFSDADEPTGAISTFSADSNFVTAGVTAEAGFNSLA